MRRLMSTGKTTMHPAASSRRNYMLDVPAAIRQPHQVNHLRSKLTHLTAAGAPPVSRYDGSNFRSTREQDPAAQIRKSNLAPGDAFHRLIDR